jgi:hypothetical protein
MVTYGPWQDSRIHEELFVLKVDAADIPSPELLGDVPTVRSGWDASNLSALGWYAIAGAAHTYAQGLDNPPGPSADLSEEAFGSAMNDTVGSGNGMQFEMLQTGEQSFMTPPPEWTQEQQWEFTGVGYRLWFDPDINSSEGSAIYAIPAGMDNATDDYFVELETLGASKPVEIVEATVLASPSGVHKLFVKDAHPTDAVPFLMSAVAQGGAATSVDQARGFPDADGDLPLDHATLNELAESGAPVIGDDWSLDGRMPTMSVLYTGPNLSVATLDGEHGVDSTHDGQPVVIRIRYRWPRWRQVYYTDPYRRIIRRGGDGRAGGARRVGQRPKTIQDSNRRGPGAIL